MCGIFGGIPVNGGCCGGILDDGVVLVEGEADSTLISSLSLLLLLLSFLFCDNCSFSLLIKFSIDDNLSFVSFGFVSVLIVSSFLSSSFELTLELSSLTNRPAEMVERGKQAKKERQEEAIAMAKAAGDASGEGNKPTQNGANKTAEIEKAASGNDKKENK